MGMPILVAEKAERLSLMIDEVVYTLLRRELYDIVFRLDLPRFHSSSFGDLGVHIIAVRASA